MIHEFSKVRLKSTGQWCIVWDFDEDVTGNLAAPSCIRSVLTLDPNLPWASQHLVDCFVADLDELTEAEKGNRKTVTRAPELIEFRFFKGDDCALSDILTILAIRQDDGTMPIWLQQGLYTDFRRVAVMNRKGTYVLAETLKSVRFEDWSRSYTANAPFIGGRCWVIRVARGTEYVSSSGCDTYPSEWRRLCKQLRHLGFPL